MILPIIIGVVGISLAVVLISELWYKKQLKDSDKAYLEDLKIQELNNQK